MIADGDPAAVGFIFGLTSTLRSELEQMPLWETRQGSRGGGGGGHPYSQSREQ